MILDRPVLAFALAFTLLGTSAGCSRSEAATQEPERRQGHHEEAARAAAGYRVGDHLSVQWKEKVYPATVIGIVDRDHVKVHYDGYNDSWDEIIGHDRIRGPAGAAPAAPAADPFAIAADGLPVTIPAPGSPAPSVAEWNAVPKEITVHGSSALGCETKMLREWLRVSCRANGRPGYTPSAVKTLRSSGQQVYDGMFGNVASVVVQVVRGKPYEAAFTWTDNRSRAASEADLLVHWAAGQDRPSISFQNR